MVSVDVKHHVYSIQLPVTNALPFQHQRKTVGYLTVFGDVIMRSGRWLEKGCRKPVLGVRTKHCPLPTSLSVQPNDQYFAQRYVVTNGMA